MIIRKITLIPVRIPLVEPFIISLGPLTHAENVVVKLETDDGETGWGECSPFRTIHGETLSTCMSIGKELAQLLIGSTIEDPVNLLAMIDSAFFGNTSIKSAFDIAFHDLLAQKKRIPLYQFLGGKINRNLVTDFTVSLSSIEKMTTDAIKIKANGFPVIKVKLGGLPKDDVERIRSIRKSVGNEIPIRIDANQGWTKEGAITALKAMEALNIEHCEEPLPRWQYTGLAYVRSITSIPIMADESCCNEYDAEKLIALNACDGINIKLGKSSGIVRAKRILQLARAHKLTIQVGGFLESRLGFTASAHFAMAYPEITCIDFDTPLMFTEDPVEGGIIYGDNGTVKLNDAPGLGAKLKDEYFSNQESVVVVSL